jgi:outer membrane protein assembly factor BamE (lipoprotein component of BamABCDE complex)
MAIIEKDTMIGRLTGLGAAVILSSLILACSTLPDDYLKKNTGKATQEDIRAKLGDPDHRYQLENGESKWVYIQHVSYATYLTYANKDAETCYNYDLTFDSQKVLKSWKEETKDCGTIN